jgi:hypothetical protein
VVAYLEFKSQVSERARDLAGCLTMVMKEFYLEVTAASEMLMICPPQSVALEKLIEDPGETTQVATHIIALSQRGSALSRIDFARAVSYHPMKVWDGFAPLVKDGGTAS